MGITLGAIYLVYGIFLVFVFAGWRRVLRTRMSPAEERFISVVIPARNEEKNIRSIVENLLCQQYTAFEIIVVDDHSEDNTQAQVSQLRSPLLKCIQNQGSGKKHAITTAVGVSNGAIIATTDADCTVPPGWLAAINASFADNHTAMVLGAVAIDGAGTLFSHMQQIEFASLTGAGGACGALGTPVMCNGANLAFTRQVFDIVDGYEGNMHIASGDDEFLMRKILERDHSSVRFMSPLQAVVRTGPQRSLRDFFHQRIRWAGKWKSNKSWLARAMAVFIFLVQLATIISLYRLVFLNDLVQAAFLIGRFLADAAILVIVCHSLKIRFDWFAYVLLFLVYPFYVVYIGIVAQFYTYEWKGRKY